MGGRCGGQLSDLPRRSTYLYLEILDASRSQSDTLSKFLARGTRMEYIRVFFRYDVVRIGHIPRTDFASTTRDREKCVWIYLTWIYLTRTYNKMSCQKMNSKILCINLNKSITHYKYLKKNFNKTACIISESTMYIKPTIFKVNYN